MVGLPSRRFQAAFPISRIAIHLDYKRAQKGSSGEAQILG
jgi:hypothetical protein